MARSDESATTLTRLGAVPVRGDISDARTLGQFLADIDVVFHIAGDYRVGIKESEHEAMFRTNVDGTTIVLDAAITAGVGRIVYVSTVTVFGNTRGRVVDETYERPDRSFLSYYDATKYFAHTRRGGARRRRGATDDRPARRRSTAPAITASSAPRSTRRRGASTRSAPSRSSASR